MAQNFQTHKRTAQGKAQTLARRTVRQTKRQDYTGYVPVLSTRQGW